MHKDTDKIKLISLDVDFTLVDDRKEIPEINREAVRWAHFDKKIHITINSGRIAPSVRDYMERLGIYEAYPSLGGCIVQQWDGEIIKENFIDRAVALGIYRTAKALGCTILAYHHDSWFIDSEKDLWYESEYQATKVKGTAADIENLLYGRAVNKLLGAHLDEEKTSRLESMILENYSEKIDCFKSTSQFLEIVPKGVNKGTAIKALCGFYGIKKENVLCIGDYFNDVDMFKASGFPVAMANAPAEIKAMAKYVTKADNNNGGVAEAIYNTLG